MLASACGQPSAHRPWSGRSILPPIAKGDLRATHANSIDVVCCGSRRSVEDVPSVSILLIVIRLPRFGVSVCDHLVPHTMVRYSSGVLTVGCGE
jgi:hypothetical protein